MAELQASQISLMKFLRENHFIIPEYQREYAWNKEKCEILWEDVKNFCIGNYTGNSYFLGSLIFFKDKESDSLDIIDGQQRITSFLLLLRAFYAVLIKMYEQNPSDKDIEGMKMQIAPCIWHGVSAVQYNTPDFERPRLETKRIYEKDKEVFRSMFSESSPELLKQRSKKKNKYLINYSLFYEKLSHLQEEGILNIVTFFEKIVEGLIILPIECNSFEMSLTIFSTLNDRGMPLADHDIFRSYLYQKAHKKGEQEVQNFKNKWNKLEKLCKETEGKTNIDDIFQYNMRVMRAEKGDTDTTTIGIRAFYKNGKYLDDTNLLSTLTNIAYFWNYIGTNFTERQGDEDAPTFSFSEKTKKYIQALMSYPNDQWRHVLTIACHKYLKKLEKIDEIIMPIVAALYYRFLETNSVTYIRPLCLRIGVNIKKEKYIFEDISFDIKEATIQNGISSRVRRGLLYLATYSNNEEQEYIDSIETLNIEHIFPRKWQNTNYQALERNSEQAKTLLENIGNLSLMEKKLNIQAGNGYFEKKAS